MFSQTLAKMFKYFFLDNPSVFDKYAYINTQFITFK